jgi:hypothetical protein
MRFISKARLLFTSSKSYRDLKHGAHATRYSICLLGKSLHDSWPVIRLLQIKLSPCTIANQIVKQRPAR